MLLLISELGFVLSAHAQFRPDEIINKITLDFKTSNDVMSGTDNDVWFDIGPKAWRIDDGFERGSVKRFTIDRVMGFGGIDIGGISSVDSLTIADIKMIRIEKKGIRLCDIFTPFDDKNLCYEMGGLSNAPDSKYELIAPDVATPAGQVKELRKDIATLDQVVVEAQGLLNKAASTYNEVTNKYNSVKNKVDELTQKVSQIPQSATEKYADVESQIARVNSVIEKTAIQVPSKICHWEEKREWIKNLLTGGWWKITKTWVCPLVENPDWVSLSNKKNDLIREKQALAADAGVEIVKSLGDAQIELSNIRLEQAAAKRSLALEKQHLSNATQKLQLLKKELGDLESFIREKLPYLNLDNIPGLNQWKLESVTVYVNDKLFGSYQINKRFKVGNSSWTKYIGEQANDIKFLNSLRIVKNKPGDSKDAVVAAGSSPLFKERFISGWDKGPVPYATAVGTLVNDPNKGWDGFVSLDLQVDTMIIGKNKYILDGHHGIKHARFIRCEYKRVKLSGEVDDRFNDKNLNGKKFRISGAVMRDLDRNTYFELHPVLSSEVEVL